MGGPPVFSRGARCALQVENIVAHHDNPDFLTDAVVVEIRSVRKRAGLANRNPLVRRSDITRYIVRHQIGVALECN